MTDMLQAIDANCGGIGHDETCRPPGISVFVMLSAFVLKGRSWRMRRPPYARTTSWNGSFFRRRETCTVTLRSSLFRKAINRASENR